MYSAQGVSITLTSEAGGVGGKSGLYLIEGNGLPIISKTNSCYQIAFPGGAVPTQSACACGAQSLPSEINLSRGNTVPLTHTERNEVERTTRIDTGGTPASNTQAFYFVDMNPDPKIKVVWTSEEYTRDCMFKRNRHLVDNSSLCICYLTKDTGGTAYTVRYARSKGKIIVNV